MGDKRSVALIEESKVRADSIRQGNVVLYDVRYARRFAAGTGRRKRIAVAGRLWVWPPAEKADDFTKVVGSYLVSALTHAGGVSIKLGVGHRLPVRSRIENKV